MDQGKHFGNVFFRFSEQGSVYEADEKHFDFVCARKSIDFLIKWNNGHGSAKNK